MQRSRMLISALLAAGLALIFWMAGHASAECPQGQACVYLPSVGKDSPVGVVPTANAQTPTPAGPTPVMLEPCAAVAPQPIEGLQVWMSNAEPVPRTSAYICARLAVNGRWVQGLPYQVVVHSFYGDGVSEGFLSYNPPWIGFANEDAGQRVRVDVAAQYLDRLYLADTSFIAPPVVTDTPTVTPTPSKTPTITATPTAPIVPPPTATMTPTRPLATPTITPTWSPFTPLPSETPTNTPQITTPLGTATRTSTPTPTTTPTYTRVPGP